MLFVFAYFHYLSSLFFFFLFLNKIKIKMNPAAIPSGNDFNATWAFLQDGLDQIMTRFEQGLDRTRYSVLYRFEISTHTPFFRVDVNNCCYYYLVLFITTVLEVTQTYKTLLVCIVVPLIEDVRSNLFICL
jgi:hypothetical protein